MIDQLLALDPGGRGIGRFFVPGGAAAAAQALRGAHRVLITTGFAVGPGLPETDGPPGAAVLGRALGLLGVDVAYVTDAVTVPPLAAALRVLGEPAPIITFQPGDDPDGAARRLLRDERPSHLLSIERPGRAADGDYRSARAESIAAWNAPLDALFLLAPRGVVTIGIGDGGNEIGMGNVRHRVVRAGGAWRAIASVVRVRHLVVAGTSNWGGWGVVAALARASGRPLLHTPDDERKLVQACVDAGAVDGITRRAEPTVDGLPLDVHAGILELFRLASAPRAAAGPSGSAPARSGAPSRRPDAASGGSVVRPRSSAAGGRSGAVERAPRGAVRTSRARGGQTR